MVNFKDKIPNNKNNVLSDDKCEVGGRVIDFKTKLPSIPPGEGGIAADQICSCVRDKLDDVITEIQNTYPSGPSYNSGKLFTQAYTPFPIDSAITGPSPGAVGFYDSVPIATHRNGENAPLVWVIADPDGAVNPADPFLYVRVSNGGSSTFNQEIPVRVGEDWGFRDVYELRIRASGGGPIAGGQQYRITTDPHNTTYVSTIVNIPPGPVPIITPPVANRPAFTTRNISVGIADSILPNIPIPNGFSLVVRSNPFNAGNSRIYVSEIDATIPANRNTLAAGDSTILFITNANLFHVAANIIGQTVDLMVEQ